MTPGFEVIRETGLNFSAGVVALASGNIRHDIKQRHGRISVKSPATFSNLKEHESQTYQNAFSTSGSLNGFLGPYVASVLARVILRRVHSNNPTGPG